MSIREVAEELGLSKGTILHHYGSKDKLLEQLHHEYMDRRLSEAHSILSLLHDPAEQLAGMVLQNLFAMHHDRDATVAFAREIVRFAREDTMDDVRRMRRDYQNLMIDILSRGMDSGDFRRDDPTMVSLQIFGMINWSWTWMNVDGPWTLDRLGESFVQLIINGLGRSDDTTMATALPRIMELVENVIDNLSRDLAEAAA